MRGSRGTTVAAVALAIATLAPATTTATTASGATSAPSLKTHRLFPTVDVALHNRRSGINNFSSGALQLHYGGGHNGIGVTAGTPKVYLVFWGSHWGTESPAGSLHFSNDSLGVAPRLKALFQGIGTNNETWSGVMTQYCDGVAAGAEFCPASAPHVGYPTGGPLAGIWVDNSTATPTTSTAQQLGQEAINAAAHFGNLDAASNRLTQYVIVSPHNTHPDNFGNAGFCAWHDDTDSQFINLPSPYGDIAFTNMPYIPDMHGACGENIVNAGDAGLLDGVTIVEGHEYAETITDQAPGGGWVDPDGQENADKCAWLSTGVGHIQNIPFSTGTFAMQGTWSNDGATCLTSHPIWGIPNLPTNYVLSASSRSGYATPGDTATTTVQSATVTGNPIPLTLSFSGGPPDSTISFDNTSITSDGSAVLKVATSATTAFGTYPMTIAATGAIVRTLSYTVTVGPPPTPLGNMMPLTNLSGATGSDQIWSFDVPAGQSPVQFDTNLGNGDADMYVAPGTLPTDDAYKCRSTGPNNWEACEIYNPTPGTWYIRIHASMAFSGMSMQATAAPTTYLHIGQIFTGLNGTAGSQMFFFVVCPTGVSRLKFRVKGFRGDADMYIRLWGYPTPFSYDYAKVRRGHHGESFTVQRPWWGAYYWIAVDGFTDYTNATIQVTT
jgi:serine protease